MADPFSVAGGAVGVISLGLTVCQGLLAYYGPFKTFHEQIDEVACRVSSLDGILNALQSVLINAHILSNSPTAQSTAIAIDSIICCHNGLQRLRKMLEKCRNTRPGNNLLGSSIQINRMLYPFRRDTLMTLMEIMNWLQANLSTSLQILNISMLIANQRQMDLVLSSSSSSAPNVDQALAAADHLDQGSVGLDGKLDMIEQHLKRLESNFLRYGTGQIMTPSLLQSISDSHEISNEAPGSFMAKGQVQRKTPRMRCSCTNCKWFTNSVGGAHYHGCEVQAQDKRIISLFKQRTFYTWMLNFSVQASLTITKGAGCFWIRPNLEFRAVVPLDSPVVSLLMDTEKGLRSRKAGFIIRSTHKKLLQLFREGKASCSDTLPNGDTILHLITGWQEYSYQWDASSWLTWRALIKDLLQNGLLSDHANDRGETPADRMIEKFDIYGRRRDPGQQQATLDICSDLLSSGGYMTHMALDWRHHLNVLNPVYHMDRHDHLFEDYSIRLVWRLAEKEGIEDIDLPEELLPLVNRSKKHLQTLLRKGINLQPWVDSYTHWPAGLALLLQSGYTTGSGTLRAACEADCEDSVKMLIRSTRCYLGPDELQVAARHHHSGIRELVVQEFIDRRKWLKVVAETFLSDELRYELSITPDTLLGFDAFRTYEALKASSFNVDDFHKDHQYAWSVYDSTGDNIELSDRLWDAGFRDVDEVYETDETCLTRMSRSPWRFVGLLEKASWLVSKGADINYKVSGSSALHILGHTVGEAIYSVKDTEEFASQLSQMSEECKRLLRRIICDRIRDNCCCPYSLNGCSAFTRLLAGLFPPRPNIDVDELIPRLATILGTIFDSQERHTWEYFNVEIVPCVLRFITSRSLGISHTCRHERYQEYEPDEITEIQDEEKHSILESDQLFEKFLSKYNELSPSLPNFLTGFWRSHMNEILSSCKTPSAEEISQILETGVILYR